jgi:hypothetical protein
VHSAQNSVISLFDVSRILRVSKFLWLNYQAVLVESVGVPASAHTIRGWDFNDGCDLDSLLGSMTFTGFQASALGQAIVEINRMVRSHLQVLCVSGV